MVTFKFEKENNWFCVYANDQFIGYYDKYEASKLKTMLKELQVPFQDIYQPTT